MAIINSNLDQCVPKRGSSVSDTLLRSLGKCRFLPAASRLDSLKSRKKGSRKDLILKVSSAGHSHAPRKQWPFCAIQVVSRNFLKWHSKRFFYSPTLNSGSSLLVLLNRMEESTSSVTHTHRVPRLCSFPASGRIMGRGNSYQQESYGNPGHGHRVGSGEAITCRSRKVFCINAYIHKGSLMKKPTLQTGMRWKWRLLGNQIKP